VNVAESRELTSIPTTVAEVELFGGYTFWNAKEGAYVVAIPASETNHLVDDSAVVLTDGLSAVTPTKEWLNAVSNGANMPVVLISGKQLYSPFYSCGAYFSGLPAGTILDIRGVYYVERFLSKSNTDLLLLANPSPSYDPVALEMVSRAAAKLPCGTKLRNNADGDWIKSVADVLGVFGVPGMPLVRAGVDAFYGAKSLYDNWGKTDERTEKMAKTLKSVGVKPSKQQRQNIRNDKRARQGKNAKNKAEFIGPVRPGENREQMRQNAKKASQKGKASGQ
jgi:hypothetical protein